MIDLSDRDLWGNPAVQKPAQLSRGRKLVRRQQADIARGVHPFGQALREPRDKTCGDCFYAFVQSGSKRWYKCAKARVKSSMETDLRLSWPACRLFVQYQEGDGKRDPRVWSAPPAEEQRNNLVRVRARIGLRIVEFWRERLRGDPMFTADDLRAHVASIAESAPASADRILRDLRQRGVLNYEVVNRAHSLYRALPKLEQIHQ